MLRVCHLCMHSTTNSTFSQEWTFTQFEMFLHEALLWSAAGIGRVQFLQQHIWIGERLSLHTDAAAVVLAQWRRWIIASNHVHAYINIHLHACASEWHINKSWGSFIGFAIRKVHAERSSDKLLIFSAHNESKQAKTQTNAVYSLHDDSDWHSTVDCGHTATDSGGHKKEQCHISNSII